MNNNVARYIIINFEIILQTVYPVTWGLTVQSHADIRTMGLDVKKFATATSKHVNPSWDVLMGEVLVQLIVLHEYIILKSF